MDYSQTKLVCVKFVIIQTLQMRGSFDFMYKTLTLYVTLIMPLIDNQVTYHHIH